MSVTPESQPVDRLEFYAPQYSRFESEAAAEIRREVYGEDLGQQGWRSFDEQTIIANLIRESSPCHVLDIACGSGGPSLSLVNQTGCRLTGVDIEVTGIERAGRQAMAQGLSHQARFEIADCSARLPYPDGAFDVIVCIDAVLHLKDRFAAISDWERLLRPQGRVLFTDAAVVTGSISIEELNIRASQGAFLLVPPGLNEEAGACIRPCPASERKSNSCNCRDSGAMACRAGAPGCRFAEIGGRRMVHPTTALSCNDRGVGGQRPPLAISLRGR